MRLPLLTVPPPLPPLAYLRPPSPLPFPLSEPTCRLFRRARRGLYEGARSLGLGPGDVVLVPAWHHGSEIEALVRAGVVPRFYHGAPDLQPDQAELESLLDPLVRALHLIHYLGFPQDGARWRAWTADHDLLLIEDAAQAWLSESGTGPVGAHGDLAIFSLYKSFGVPDGGAAAWSRSSSPPAASGGIGVAATARRHAAWLMSKSGFAAELGGRAYRRRQYDPVADFALDAPAGPSLLTVLLLPRVIEPDAAARRRRNYQLMLGELGELVPTPFGSVPSGASPFAFPISVPDKDAAQARLLAHGVRAVDLWSVPHPALPSEQFPAAAQLRSQLLGLPVHQELAERDLERIVSGAREPRARRRRSRAGRPSSSTGDAARRTTDDGLVLRATESLAALEAPWRTLAPETRNVFSTWEWATRWWSHEADPHRRLALVLCCRPDGTPVAILPLCMENKGLLRVARFVGFGAGDQLGLVCAPRDRAAAVRALRQFLDQQNVRWDVLLAERMKGDEGWAELLGGQVIRVDASPVIEFGSRTWDEYLAERSRKLRRQIRQQERRLIREHGVEYRLTTDRDTLSRDLDAFFALHQARWSNGSSSLLPRSRFLRDFALDAFEQGWLRLWFLEVGSRPIAARYDLYFGGVHVAYNSGRDPEFAHYSPGLVLRAHTMRHAREEGATEYRFLRGAEEYKFRFTDRDPGLLTTASGRGFAGRALVAATAPLLRQPAARATIRRLR